MNNKTIKCVVALVATVLLLCTCAFAAEIGEVTYDAATGEISVPFTAGEGAVRAALMVKNGDEIVALAQFNNIDLLEEATMFNEVIDTAKVDVGDTLTISVGDDADGSTLADTTTLEVEAAINTYTITFVDEDGTTVLYSTTVEEGVVPVYAGEAPTKAEDETNTYAFAGWTPEIVAATADATYTATYTATPIPSEPEYEVSVQNVTYNSIAGKVVRITGLDPAAVTVSVAGVTAKYYDRRDADGVDTGVDVIIAAIPDTDDENAIVIENGTTGVILFGDADGNGRFNSNDASTIARRDVNATFRNNVQYYPTDLMELLVHDVDGNGRVNSNDASTIARADVGALFRNKVMSEQNMTCYTK